MLPIEHYFKEIEEKKTSTNLKNQMIVKPLNHSLF